MVFRDTRRLPTAEEVVTFYGGELWEGEETEIKMNARDLAIWRSQSCKRPIETTGRNRPTR